MRIVWAVACRYAEMSDGGGATMIGAGVDQTVVPTVPFDLTLTIVLKLAARPDEAGTDHTIGFCFRDPLLEMSGPFEDTIQVPELHDDHPEGLEDATVIPTMHVFTVERPGLHQIDIEIDGRNGASVPFYVALADEVDAG